MLPNQKKKFYQTDLISCSEKFFRVINGIRATTGMIKESDEYFSDHHPFQTTIATDCLKSLPSYPGVHYWLFQFLFFRIRDKYKHECCTGYGCSRNVEQHNYTHIRTDNQCGT